MAIEGLNSVEQLSGDIGRAFTSFSEYYNNTYTVNPSFYVTRSEGDHVDISTSNPIHKDSSPVRVLYHFFIFCKLHNLLADCCVALSGHIRHLHITRGQGEPVGYWAEIENKEGRLNPVTGNPYAFIFTPDLDFLMGYYSAFPLDSPATETRKPSGGSAPTKIPNKLIIFLIIGVIIIIGFYYYKKRMGDIDDSGNYTEPLFFH